ncbi:MAG: PfkB family carbohydrate kinase [Bacteroidota bacterium]|nr:PfkB family carbohydrate kinase [Bacteroidota bacterium]MDP3146160.1 PfkB family carbohydrate kinase [Bacteroidota bacterium]
MLKELELFFDEIKNLNVLVVGETIVDEFIDVSYEGQSMKSICPVFKLEGTKIIQQGGAQAIANHIYDFVKKVSVITNTNNEIVKTRYVDVSDKKKHVEINKFETENFEEINIDTSKYDVVIVADFGHGFCDKLTITDGFHLMCQTNSNNFGFNRISKWKNLKKKSACIDLREASLQVNKRISNPKPQDIIDIFNYELNSEHLFVTTGKQGSTYTSGKEFNTRKSFKTDIVDTIGAGDTFFAFASLCASLDDKIKDKLLVPSLAASLSTTWLCNEKSVTKELLLNHAAKHV